MARRTKEDAEKTRELLLDAAETLFLEKGVAATSLEDIARHVGMTRGAVYWHFENKQGLFDAMHERVCLPLEQDYEQVMQQDDIIPALRTHCLYALEHITRDARVRNTVTILLLKCEANDPSQSNVERVRREREEIIEEFVRAFVKAKDSRQIADHIDPKAAAIALHALVHGLIRDCVSQGGTDDVLPLAPQMLDIFFNGLGVEKAS